MSDSEIFFQNSESTSLTFTGNELKIKENSEFSGYGVRVLDNKRVGFSYCQEESQIDSTIEKAKKIVIAFEEAETKGLGVVSLGSKMIDPPVVKRAQRTIKLAVETGKLSPDWREGGMQNG